MKQTYTGSCHCGAVRFEVDMDLDHVRVCDCTLCRKRGASNHRVEDSDLRIETPLQEMTLYQWHTRVARDYFCPTCGILPFRRPRTAPGLWAVNIDDAGADRRFQDSPSRFIMNTLFGSVT
ncbi:MAG: GFA family protein [Gammaproteobacteria bacterium]